MRQYLYNLITDKENGFGSCMIKAFLFILSVVYGPIVRILVFFCRKNLRRINCKVISVGNITLGGTGKTSLVELTARFLKERGHKVAILSRGYSRTKAPDSIGDEPHMLQMKLKDIPIIVDPDRIRGAQRAIKGHGVDTVILDDGFQQWRINKDLEIVVIDSLNPFGNGYILPRGILREPFVSLKRADMFLLSKTNLDGNTQQIKALLNKFNPQAQIIESVHRPLGFYDIEKPEELLAADILKGETAALFSGIGDPGSFEKLITGLGIKTGLAFRFPDHHNYSKIDLDKIVKDSKERNINTIITTEKDAARLCAQRRAHSAGRILFLRIELAIKDNDKERFFNRLLTLYPL